MTEWYLGSGTPDLGWWWAVQHDGHPAFYLRALMPGDFGPGRGGPLARHALSLDGAVQGTELRCGTCDATPAAADLEPIERATGARGFLDDFRARRRPWPPATDPASCWLCSSRTTPAEHLTRVGHATVAVCERCAEHLARERGGP